MLEIIGEDGGPTRGTLNLLLLMLMLMLMLWTVIVIVIVLGIGIGIGIGIVIMIMIVIGWQSVNLGKHVVMVVVFVVRRSNG